MVPGFSTTLKFILLLILNWAAFGQSPYETNLFQVYFVGSAFTFFPKILNLKISSWKSFILNFIVVYPRKVWENFDIVDLVMTLLDNLHIAKKTSWLTFPTLLVGWWKFSWSLKKSLENLVVFQLDDENYATKISVRSGVNVE